MINLGTIVLSFPFSMSVNSMEAGSIYLAHPFFFGIISNVWPSAGVQTIDK
jgi:hypothetical protein